MECGCLWSVVSTNAARYQMAPICSKRRGPKANGTTQTHCNSPITFAWPFFGTLHVWMITQMPRGSCQLSLQRTGGDHEDALASHGWAPYSIIWNPIISHCLKQWILDMAQNRSLWRMWSTYSTMQSQVACQKLQRITFLNSQMTKKLSWCWFVGGDDLTGALHDL